ncbi:hypothetical protein BU596_01660 [Staphylococcus arlettae]|nr:hypothetical protein BU596_01660 [Staphylococcus arlettae]
MKAKKYTIKLIILIICLVIYTYTDMPDKYNIFLLIILAVIAGTAIHLLVEFVFNIIEKFTN